MKLLILTCIEEMLDDMKGLLNQAGAQCMNVTSAESYRKSEACTALSWFGRGSACEHANTLLIFSFMPEASAHSAIELVNDYNLQHPSHFQPRAFSLDISESTSICPDHE